MKEKILVISLLLLFASCDSGHVKLQPRQVFVEYQLLKYHQFQSMDRFYEPDNISIKLLVENETGHPMVIPRSQLFGYLMTKNDKVAIKAIKEVVIPPHGEGKIYGAVAYFDVVKLKSVFVFRDVDNITRAIKSVKIVLESDLKHSMIWDNCDFLFSFADMTYYVSPDSTFVVNRQ